MVDCELAFSQCAQHKMFFTKNFLSKCDQKTAGFRLRIWSHLLKISLMKNFISVQWRFFLVFVHWISLDFLGLRKFYWFYLFMRLLWIILQYAEARHFSLEDKTLHKKWSFPLLISSVNVTKSAVSCGFGHIYWRNH